MSGPPNSSDVCLEKIRWEPFTSSEQDKCKEHFHEDKTCQGHRFGCDQLTKGEWINEWMSASNAVCMKMGYTIKSSFSFFFLVMNRTIFFLTKYISENPQDRGVEALDQRGYETCISHCVIGRNKLKEMRVSWSGTVRQAKTGFRGPPFHHLEKPSMKIWVVNMT